ncbi:IS21 family transposase [Candidatus Nanopelagicales bacterium]|nr:IS21 family transposase [Candidatus Nanopelagicales bacterium]
MENWAEIRRLSRSEGLSQRAIAKQLGVARDTVAAALASEQPPQYSRAPRGSSADAFDPAIRELLRSFPSMPATVIAERIGWQLSSSTLRAKVATLRPLYQGVDPADRTTYSAGELAQCDLWFPPAKIPLGHGQVGTPPVLVVTSAYSRFIAAVMIPSRRTGDLLAGMWSLLNVLGGAPKTLVWDNEPGIGQRRRLTDETAAFAGTIGNKILQVRPRDPEAKGVVERANGYLETSFMPGRTFASAQDFNTQLAGWLTKANTRMVRRIAARPVERLHVDRAAMLNLPPVAPRVGLRSRVRLPRDYYVRVEQRHPRREEDGKGKQSGHGDGSTGSRCRRQTQQCHLRSRSQTQSEKESDGDHLRRRHQHRRDPTPYILVTVWMISEGVSPWPF